jgi:hypothetical protein
MFGAGEFGVLLKNRCAMGSHRPGRENVGGGVDVIREIGRGGGKVEGHEGHEYEGE